MVGFLLASRNRWASQDLIKFHLLRRVQPFFETPPYAEGLRVDSSSWPFSEENPELNGRYT